MYGLSFTLCAIQMASSDRNTCSQPFCRKQCFVPGWAQAPFLFKFCFLMDRPSGSGYPKVSLAPRNPSLRIAGETWHTQHRSKNIKHRQTSPPVKDTHMQNGHDLTDDQGLKLSCLLWTQRYYIDACGPEAGLQAFRLSYEAACSDIKRIKHTRIEKESCSQE